MTSKKFIVIFLLILLILSIFNFSSVQAENTNVTSSSSERMKDDIDYFKQLLKNNNINNMGDLVSFSGVNSADDIEYFYIEDAGHTTYNRQNVYFYSSFNGVSFGDNNYSYYCVQQNSFTLQPNRSYWFSCDGSNDLHKIIRSSFTAPICWCGVKTADLFSKDSSQIVASAVKNINVISSSSERMKNDIDYLKQLFRNNNINNMSDLASFLYNTSTSNIEYIYIQDAGHSQINYQYAYFYNSINGIATGVDIYNYYGIKQDGFNLLYNYSIGWKLNDDYFAPFHNNNNYRFTAPLCWYCVRTADLFTIDSWQIVASAVENVNKSVGDVNKSVGNVNNSINNLNDKITEDNSSQDDINLGSHNDEMGNASDTIKNSNLYSKFNNIVDKMDNAFSYSDDEPSTLQISFNGKSFVLRSDEISSFFKNNNLGFVVLLWQSILWFSLFYTMFLFTRKLYKAFSGGNPVDEVSSTLSNEDNKIVGGF